MITVPACRRHNNGESLDDEYFRLVMSVRHDTFERSDAEGASARALERMQRKESERFRRSFVKSIREEDVFTPAGIYLGTRHAFDVDMSRIVSVVGRIVRGLFFHHTKQRLPDACTVTVYPVESYKKPDAAIVRRFLEIIAWVNPTKRRVSPRNVLMYKYRQRDEDPTATAWMMQFYESVPFLAATANPQLSRLR